MVVVVVAVLVPHRGSAAPAIITITIILELLVEAVVPSIPWPP
jgi:hypothetical protein